MSAAAEQIIFLRFLLQATTKQQNCLLKLITTQQLDAVGEVCYNILYGEVDVAPLKQHQRIIRVLGDKKVSARRRRALVVKHPRTVILAVRQALKDDS